MLGELPEVGAQGVEQGARDEHDVGGGEAAGEDKRRLVGRAFAELHDERVVGAGAEGEFGLRRVQAEGLEVGARGVGDKLGHGPLAQPGEQFLDERGVRTLGRGGQRDAPEAVGGIALQQEIARAGADAEAVELHARQREERAVTPRVSGLGQVAEEVGVGDGDVTAAGDLQVNLVVDRGARADAQLDGRVTLMEPDGGLRRLKTEVGGGLHLRSGDDDLRPATGADFQQGADEQRVGRVAQRRGEPPLPGGKLGADGGVGECDLDAGHGGGAQARDQLTGGGRRRWTAGAAQLVERDERKEREGEPDEPFCLGGVHAFVPTSAAATRRAGRSRESRRARLSTGSTARSAIARPSC